MSTDTIQAVSGSVSQKQAIENAKAAFAKLPSGDSVFQQCINDQETVHEVLAALHKQYRVHKRKKFTRLLEAFHRYTSWMNSISGSINLAVQTSSSISCPLWAPIKFVLKVYCSCVNCLKSGIDLVRSPRIILRLQSRPWRSLK
jgi:hypothetical protein